MAQASNHNSVLPSTTRRKEGADIIVNESDDSSRTTKVHEAKRRTQPRLNGKQLVGLAMLLTMLAVAWDLTMRPAEERYIKPDASDRFLLWVQENPYTGTVAFLLVIAACLVLLIPVGPPLIFGCGYIYKEAYGWFLGVTVATSISTMGSILGSVGCFLLGRYLMRERVRKWIRCYPTFDAIDVAISEKGFRIMAMLFLTPILPLGPVSYMCGTSSMRLPSFAVAQFASTPVKLLYVFIGASAGTLLSGESTEQLESHKALIMFGILMSCVTIGAATHCIKRELRHSSQKYLPVSTVEMR